MHTAVHKRQHHVLIHYVQVEVILHDMEQKAGCGGVCHSPGHLAQLADKDGKDAADAGQHLQAVVDADEPVVAGLRGQEAAVRRHHQEVA